MSIADVRDAFTLVTGVPCERATMRSVERRKSQYTFYVSGRESIIVVWDKPFKAKDIAQAAMSVMNEAK